MHSFISIHTVITHCFKSFPYLQYALFKKAFLQALCDVKKKILPACTVKCSKRFPLPACWVLFHRVLHNCVRHCSKGYRQMLFICTYTVCMYCCSKHVFLFRRYSKIYLIIKDIFVQKRKIVKFKKIWYLNLQFFANTEMLLDKDVLHVLDSATL